MNRGPTILICIAAVVVSLISFSIGDRLPAYSLPFEKSSAPSGSRSGQPGFKSSNSEAIDLSSVTITNVGSLGFDQIFDLLSNADATLRQKWANELERMPHGPQKRAAVIAFYKALAQVDPNSAVQLILACKNEPTREMAVRSVTSATSPSEMPIIAKMLEQLPPDELRGHSDVVLAWWSAVDPVAASRFVEANASNIGHDSYFVLLRNWARLDAVAAEAWFGNLHLADDEWSGARNGFVIGLLEGDQPAALNYLVAHADDKNFRPVLATAARGVFVESPEEARAFVLRLGNAEVGAIAVAQIAKLYDSSWFEEWRRPPEAIAKWMVTLPPEIYSPNIAPSVGAWDDADQTAFRGWLNQLPVETRNVVAAGFCAGAGEEKLADAILIAESITDSSLREQTLKGALQQSGKTRDEILELIGSLALTPKQRTFLLNLAPEE